VLLRLRTEARDGAVEICDEGVDPFAQLEDQCGIDHVLAGRAPMHIAGSLLVGLGDFSGQHLHQRDGNVTAGHRILGDLAEIEPLGAAGIGNRRDSLGGNDAGRGFRPRQRRFEVEHPLQPRLVVRHGAHRCAGKQRCEQGGERKWAGHWSMTRWAHT
jgi:hypothetical protein